MNRALRIFSYFSVSTDLAGEMHGWPEFILGQGYDVDLRSADTGESVTVRYVETNEVPYVIVKVTGTGTLFDRVVGRAVDALSKHSDYVQVDTYV